MRTISEILSVLANHSSRPRYAFMLLGLLSEAADHQGRLGPTVGQAKVPVRDWLSEALQPLASRDTRRAALQSRVAQELADSLPADQEDAQRQLEQAVAERIRRSTRTNVSRTMTDLERAGLVRRHYAGWRTNHRNRGGGRFAVYTVDAEALAALRRQPQLL